MHRSEIAQLSDEDLDAQLLRLAQTEHDTTVELIEHLAELAARRLHLAAGFRSLFEYCRERLGLSEGEAYNRIVASRAVRRFPYVLSRLADGAVNLTTVRLLFKHLTPENHRELVDAAAGKSRREVERLVAARFPQPAVAFSVRKLAAAAERQVTSPSVVASNYSVALPIPAVVALQPAVPDLAPSTQTRGPRPAHIKPINEDQFSVRFTARASTWDKLQAAQDLLRHAVPNGDVAEIFDRALQLLLEDLARKKFAATTRPRAIKGTHPDSRDLPAWLMRAVWVRDCGRCAFVSTTGRRCSARGGLEFHHVHPYAEGGKATLENIVLRCRSHNLHEMNEFYAPIRKALNAISDAIPGWSVSEKPSRAIGNSA
jgi:5-methylcytosine-specific restriction endonuclease McrA